MTRPQVITFQSNPTDPQVQVLKDELQRTVGRISSLVDICLFFSVTGLVGNTVASAATIAPPTQLKVDFADAGLDFVRILVVATGTGNNPSANIYNVTTGQVICSVPVGGSAEALTTGQWVSYTPHGGDETIGFSFTNGSAGSESVTLWSVHLQAATLNAKP